MITDRIHACFNPRRPRGRRRDAAGQSPAQRTRVSIHAAREGGDRTAAATEHRAAVFQSTPPARAATQPARRSSMRDRDVSIHAAREGGDPGVVRCLRRCPSTTFQSTPPARAATRSRPLPHASGIEFQSTPPARAATLRIVPTVRQSRVSIHAAREGGDGVTRLALHGVAVSIHAAREGGDGSHLNH